MEYLGEFNPEFSSQAAPLLRSFGQDSGRAASLVSLALSALTPHPGPAGTHICTHYFPDRPRTLNILGAHRLKVQQEPHSPSFSVSPTHFPPLPTPHPRLKEEIRQAYTLLWV